MEFAIVDIETTGGHAAGNGITEVAIYIHDGERVIKKFETLINPAMPIPYYISGLTGITDSMVRTAPLFSSVAEDVYRLLHNRTFVAHSVNFDYSFIKHALKVNGYELNCKKLCTVRLSRKILPGFPSYSLGNLCSALGIPLNSRHRAGGDAAATVLLFERLLKTDYAGVTGSLKRGSKEQALPPHLLKEEFERLPECPGVYYFLDKQGKVIYVGKAVNIKKRVFGHFTGNSPQRQKQEFIRRLFHVRCITCVTEEDAFKLESREIKRLYPPLNRAQKQPDVLVGIVCYYDLQGYARLAVKKLKSRREHAILVGSVAEGYETLNRIAKEYNLCQRLAGIHKRHDLCVEQQCVCNSVAIKGIADYNEAVANVFNEMAQMSKTEERRIPVQTEQLELTLF